jgi:hypothetical protein
LYGVSQNHPILLANPRHEYSLVLREALGRHTSVKSHGRSSGLSHFSIHPRVGFFLKFATKFISVVKIDL